MNKVLALDLFCCAGGAGMGLSRAGFKLTGVDIKFQPRYPFTFFQRSALDYTVELIQAGGWKYVWASPPCQTATLGAQQHLSQLTHPDLIPIMRETLTRAGVLWTIENVPQAKLQQPLVLTGDMFGLNTYRRRHFESNFHIPQPPIGPPFGPRTRPGSVTVAGHTGGWSLRDKYANGTKADWEAAMGIDWMTARELAEAIPPAYSTYIGSYAIKLLEARA